MNSIHQLDESNHALAARISPALARKTPQAKQLKYRLGAEQVYFVQEAQTELAQAEQSVVQAEIGYQLALTAVDHSLGSLLIIPEAGQKQQTVLRFAFDLWPSTMNEQKAENTALFDR